MWNQLRDETNFTPKNISNSIVSLAMNHTSNQCSAESEPKSMGPIELGIGRENFRNRGPALEPNKNSRNLLETPNSDAIMPTWTKIRFACLTQFSTIS